MSQVTVNERIYVNDKGKRVEASYKGDKRLAAVPGDTLSAKRAEELDVKEKKPPEDKEKKPGDNKGFFPGLNKRS